ncbi:DNA-binding GntR family transcriptional regulator [Sphingomonas sp. PvP055]
MSRPSSIGCAYRSIACCSRPSTNPERIDDANAGHRKITVAIVAGDAARAERLMRAHIAEALEVAVRLESDIAV